MMLCCLHCQHGDSKGRLNTENNKQIRNKLVRKQRDRFTSANISPGSRKKTETQSASKDISERQLRQRFSVSAACIVKECLATSDKEQIYKLILFIARWSKFAPTKGQRWRSEVCNLFTVVISPTQSTRWIPNIHFHILTDAVAQFLYKLNSSFVAPNDCFFDKFDENYKAKTMPKTTNKIGVIVVGALGSCDKETWTMN